MEMIHCQVKEQLKQQTLISVVVRLPVNHVCQTALFGALGVEEQTVIGAVGVWGGQGVPLLGNSHPPRGQNPR